MNEERQLTLQFEHRPALSGEDFLVSDCNRAAVDWIDAWPEWPAPALVIIGPPGSGKSHLAAVFATKSGAREILPDSFESAAPSVDYEIVIEDIDASLNAGHEEPLLHLYNSAKESGHRILFTAATPPVRWKVGLPDLRSRLNAALTVEIGPPEDTLIAALLVKMFADRQVQVSTDAITYTVSRMERSFFAARQIVDKADQMAMAEKKRITVPLMKQVLKTLGDI
ncbi:MAG: DNA replication protein [Rhodospirillales bacterium]|nr:DNA replication protein [Rhodospirillales bacterium]